MSSAEYRIIDASLNRAAEGLRVVEEYARFVLNDGHLSRLLKELRHELAAAAEVISPGERHNARDTPGDVGTAITTPAETTRIDAWHVCQANCERVKQSLRSLEEYGKALARDAAPIPLPRREGPGEGREPANHFSFPAAVEQLRYRFYALESALARTADAALCLADVKLCVLVDGRASEAEFTTLVEQLLRAGVDMLQLRDKQLSDRDLLARAQLLVQASRGVLAPGAPLAIINDRPDIAAAVDADGVHLGQDDLTPAAARSILGPRKLIGLSTHSLEQARAAVLAGANYLGAGPTFPSTTKSFAAFPGLDYLRQLAAEIALPAFAIGGITTDNLAQVQATGIERIAVSCAVANAQNPQAAAKALLARLRLPIAGELQSP